MRTATFTAMIGNADTHGKNLAFVYDAPGELRLAPLYDTVPTVLFPRLRTDAAMTIGGCVDLATVDLAAVQREARRWHLSATAASAAAIDTAEQLLAALRAGAIDPSSPVATFVAARCDAFLRTAVGRDRS
jgi:serine/threonine-protein kinase HipA